ncbi:MAG: hypothetical protein HRT71_17595 [Flavobacteriales bacterium]|nr:hypothetical protein [Flavobacteriales bacterium]
MKSLLLTILSIFIYSSILGQSKINLDKLDCEKIGKEILSDTTLNVWNYPDLELLDYNCLGQYFAKWDIAQGNYVIQTYGSPEHQNACRLCNYEEFNISFHYHFDIIQDNVSEFISGYNLISKPSIKESFGKNIFDTLDSVDSQIVSPQKIFELLQEDKGKSYLIVSIINDTLINVKIDFDSISKKAEIDLTNLSINVIDLFNEMETKTFSYLELKTNGTLLNEHSNDKYYLSLEFDFSRIKGVCYCDKVKKYMAKWNIPITVKNKENVR